MGVDISPFIKDAQKIQAQTGIPASIILGQIMLESGGKNPGGLSGLAYFHKNLFGVKGKGNAGSVNMPTTEYKNGKPYKTNANFRKYHSFYDSMLDHARLLQTERYAKHLRSAKSIEDYAKGIKAGGYATDTNYVNLLLGTIQKNGLNKYDNGNYTFTGVAMPGTGAATGSGGGDGGGNMLEGMFNGILRATLFILCILAFAFFFFKAFPAVEQQVKAVSK